MQGLFKEETRQYLLIITPYRRQKNPYEQAFLELQRKNSLPIGNFPVVSTIHSIQGGQGTMVIFDTVASKAHNRRDLGFLMDVRRACAAFTRAQHIF